MARNITGSKYNRDLTIVEIAKQVRQDIKAACRAGILPPDLKTGVRVSKYSGGRSLDIIVKSPYFEHGTAEYRFVESELDNIMNAYNYDNSDTMVDYFDVNFYGHVRFEDNRNVLPKV